MPNKIDEKFNKDKMKVEVLKNDSLCCKDCKFKYDDSVRAGNVSMCEKFKIKPIDVLKGLNCEKYKKV